MTVLGASITDLSLIRNTPGEKDSAEPLKLAVLQPLTVASTQTELESHVCPQLLSQLWLKDLVLHRRTPLMQKLQKQFQRQLLQSTPLLEKHAAVQLLALLPRRGKCTVLLWAVPLSRPRQGQIPQPQLQAAAQDLGHTHLRPHLSRHADAS